MYQNKLIHLFLNIKMLGFRKNIYIYIILLKVSTTPRYFGKNFSTYTQVRLFFFFKFIYIGISHISLLTSWEIKCSDFQLPSSGFGFQKFPSFFLLSSECKWSCLSIYFFYDLYIGKLMEWFYAFFLPHGLKFRCLLLFSMFIQGLCKHDALQMSLLTELSWLLGKDMATIARCLFHRFEF